MCSCSSRHMSLPKCLFTMTFKSVYFLLHLLLWLVIASSHYSPFALLSSGTSFFSGMYLKFVYYLSFLPHRWNILMACCVLFPIMYYRYVFVPRPVTFLLFLWQASLFVSARWRLHRGPSSALNQTKPWHSTSHSFTFLRYWRLPRRAFPIINVCFALLRIPRKPNEATPSPSLSSSSLLASVPLSPLYAIPMTVFLH